ncbi:hypothetical protein ACSLBF_06535 [Pseudoalteromonas sp. T1lg65]|uniref:hypothetical protein n=1 Tax=Pseudoalteromonas sp. T1lg65 TaxID=2077101 RepID=UPI003F7ACA58
MIAKSTRPWWQGYMGHWLKECGASNYALPGLFLALLTPFTSMLEDDLSPFILTATVSLSCLWIAFCWQLVKLQAQEWTVLLPEYKKHIYLQGSATLTFGYLMLLISAINIPLIDVFLMAFFTIAIGAAFFVSCMHSSRVFKYHTYAFMLLLTIPILLKTTPLELATFIGIPSFVFTVWTVATKELKNAWHPDARLTYLNNIKSGWLPTSIQIPEAIGNRFRLWFMPLSYFAGNIVLQMVAIYLLLSAACIIAIYLGLLASADFLVGLTDMMVLMVAILVNWVRLQSKMNWEILYMLPIYSSINSIKRGFLVAAIKLGLLLCLSQLLILIIAGVASEPFSLTDLTLIFVASLSYFLIAISLGGMISSSAVFSIFCLIYLFGMGVLKGIFMVAKDPMILISYTIVLAALTCISLYICYKKIRTN